MNLTPNSDDVPFSRVFQVLLEMSPGLPVEKFVLSHSDLKHHREDVHSYSTADIVTAMSKESGFETAVRNPKSKKHETLRDLLCFGNGEVSVSLCSIYPVPLKGKACLPQ